jgi:hypothetical protein
VIFTYGPVRDDGFYHAKVSPIHHRKSHLGVLACWSSG